MKKIKKEILKELLPPNPVILDVGCYDGTDGLEIHEMLGGELHSFDPGTFDIFKGHGKDNVIFYPFALWAADGQCRYYPSDHRQSGSIPEPKEHLKIWPDIKFRDYIYIRAHRLDTVWPKNKHIDFIWADVNGSEGGFILGAEETLKNTSYMYLEYGKKEIYEGQVNTRSIKYKLKGWTILENFEGPDYGNYLLRNDNLQRVAAGTYPRTSPADGTEGT